MASRLASRVLHLGGHFLRVAVLGARSECKYDTHELRGGAVRRASIRRLALPLRRVHLAERVAAAPALRPVTKHKLNRGYVRAGRAADEPQPIAPR
jgi:hypothetical protein